jgi:hypothetical protein
MEDTMDGDTDVAAGPHPALIDRLLGEAAALGEEARTRLEQPVDARGMAYLHAQRELGVVATCLGFSVAWLLEQKAVAAGELEAASDPPLAGAVGAPAPDPALVDDGIVALGTRVRAFAERIERLAAA